MNSRLTSFILLAVIILPLSLSAQWSWEEDYSFHNPNLDRYVVEHHGVFQQGFFADFSGDGFPEYILFNPWWNDTCVIHLLEAEGEFPAIVWHYKNGFFNGVDLGFSPREVSAYDVDGDNSPELLFPVINGDTTSFVIYHNAGDFQEPQWEILEGEWLPRLDRGHILAMPHLLDYDNNGKMDLLVGFLSGFDRYEQDENDEWQESESISFGDEWLWAITHHFADMDNDGDFDVVCAFETGSGGTTGGMLLNLGMAGEEEWSDVIWLNKGDNYLPLPTIADLNRDNLPDVVNQYNYYLNTGGEDTLTFSGKYMWSIYTGGGEIYDCVGDSKLEILQLGGGELGYGVGLVQFQLTPGGWNNARFYDSDFNDWGYPEGNISRLWAVDFFNEGQPCLATYEKDNDHPLDQFELYKDIDPDESLTWQVVEGFFDDIAMEAFNQSLSFADIDIDGDPDVIRLSQVDYQPRDSMSISFFEFRWNGENPQFELREDWGRGLEDIYFKTVEFADFDGGGDLELVGLVATEVRYLYNVVVFKNPNLGQDAWSLVDGAFDEGPLIVKSLDIGDVDQDGSLDIVTSDRVYLNRHSRSVKDTQVPPHLFIVSSVYPNPFNSSTTIEYRVGANSNSPVRLSLYDLSGRLVQTLVEGRLTPGKYRMTLDANGLAAGVYVVKLDPPQPPLERGEYCRKVVVVK